MTQDEWKDWYKVYKQSIREWKEEYRKSLNEWRRKLRNWRIQAKSNIAQGMSPPMPPMPPIPPIRFASTGRSNVVASRIGDEELQLIDMLTEAGLFSTRSEAVAYLVSAGIKARQDIIDKVSSALEEIRRIRKEAEERVEKLRREIGLREQEEAEEERSREGTCPECGKDLSDLPEDIVVCPYCGVNLKD